MTRRSYIRFLSYITLSLIILITLAVINTRNMTNYKIQLENSYQQSLVELSECIENIDTDLTKSLYSNSSGEMYDLNRDLYAQCSTAKNAISRLPLSQMELNNAYKFLSQASDYSQYIGSKIEANEGITDKEHKNLVVLLGYADKLRNQTNDMVRIVESGGKITNGDVKSDNTLSVSSLNSGFDVAAKTFESYPTLLYDGPFSDQVLNKKSSLVKGSKVTSKDECQTIAAKALDVPKTKVAFSEDEQSKMPCYTYKCGRYTVSVTKQGGYIKSILYSGMINSSSISTDNAVNLASDFLKANGYENMAPTYYSINDNICTIVFAYVKDGVYYYSDLIKCGVSMSDGKILTLDACTYLTNHKKRKASTAKISEADCKKLISRYLNINSIKRCVIPKSSGVEVDCYEFSCTSKDTGEDTLIYINSNNGNEEDIMLLLYTDNGTLVK